MAQASDEPAAEMADRVELFERMGLMPRMSPGLPNRYEH